MVCGDYIAMHGLASISKENTVKIVVAYWSWTQYFRSNCAISYPKARSSGPGGHEFVASWGGSGGEWSTGGMLSPVYLRPLAYYSGLVEGVWA